MKNAVLKKLTEEVSDQDEIRAKCEHCGTNQLIAYWDYELEYYIYLSDTPVCSECQENIAHEMTVV